MHPGARFRVTRGGCSTIAEDRPLGKLPHEPKPSELPPRLESRRETM